MGGLIKNELSQLTDSIIYVYVLSASSPGLLKASCKFCNRTIIPINCFKLSLSVLFTFLQRGFGFSRLTWPGVLYWECTVSTTEIHKELWSVAVYTTIYVGSESSSPIWWLTAFTINWSNRNSIYYLFSVGGNSMTLIWGGRSSCNLWAWFT